MTTDDFEVIYPTGGGAEFSEYRRLILSELKRLNRAHEKQTLRNEDQIDGLRDTFVEKFELLTGQVAELKSDARVSERERKMLSGILGFAGGVVPSLGALIWWLVKT